jgi:hypothetical protein
LVEEARKDPHRADAEDSEGRMEADDAHAGYDGHPGSEQPRRVRRLSAEDISRLDQLSWAVPTWLFGKLLGEWHADELNMELSKFRKNRRYSVHKEVQHKLEFGELEHTDRAICRQMLSTMLKHRRHWGLKWKHHDVHHIICQCSDTASGWAIWLKDEAETPNEFQQILQWAQIRRNANTRPRPTVFRPEED